MFFAKLKIMLGMLPSTESIERKHDELVKEYEEFKQFASSEELAHYLELEKFVESKEFDETRIHYLSLNYANSHEETKEKEYLSQKKWREIQFYYKYKTSKELALFDKLDGSDAIKHFEELKAFVESEEFLKVETYMKDPKKWEKTDEHHKFMEYSSLKENASFKNYFKFIHDKAYEDFRTLYKSDESEHYHELVKFIESEAFVSKKASMQPTEFKQTEEHAKLEECTKIKNSPKYKHYLSLFHSELLHDYKKIHNSNELAYYKELEAFVKSEAYTQKKKEIESLRFENTEEYKKQQEFKKLNADGEIKHYFKVKNSEEITEFKNLEGGKIITEYEALETEVLSDEFKARKVYLLDKKKWEKTEEYARYAEYLKLKKSDKITWYFATQKTNKFSKLDEWTLIFEENFNDGKLDKNKWLTRHFWGEMLLHESYSLPGELHSFTDGNIEIGESIAKITTQSQKVNGKEWNPMLGFYPREYNFTSGLLSTASSFRTKYGKIEAKVKFRDVPGVLHSFWLKGDTIVPQIDVFKNCNKKVQFNSFWGNPTEPNGIKSNSSSIGASSLNDKFVIFSIVWDAEKIEWRINNLLINSQTNNIPDEALYLVVSSGVINENAQTPIKMEVDWIRCYQAN